MWQLQGFDSTEFVNQYWQKKPCVLRNVFDHFESPVSAEELAGLACEDEVHCRLVIEKGGTQPWQVRYGPFTEQDFLDLPESHYSLLVSECEKWMPELNGLLDQFRFIPDWRIDDLMISYAPKHGSVGPHVDEYDVFLLQAQGQRRWLYNDSRIENPKLIPDLELAILEQFDPDQDTVLNPGDMLYLPPGCAHHGIALDPCLTYSIGFRAPSAVTTLESLTMEIDRTGLGSMRYEDPNLELDRHHSEITTAEIKKFGTLASEVLRQSGSLWQDAVGKMLSDSPVVRDESDNQPFYVSDLRACNWIRHPETRLLYHQDGEIIRVYFNGRSHNLPNQNGILELVRNLCDKREWSQNLINKCIAIEALEKLLIELAYHDAIVPIEE